MQRQAAREKLEQEDPDAAAEERLRRRALQEKQERDALEEAARAKREAETEAQWRAKALAKHRETQQKVD